MWITIPHGYLPGDDFPVYDASDTYLGTATVPAGTTRRHRPQRAATPRAAGLRLQALPAPHPPSALPPRDANRPPYLGAEQAPPFPPRVWFYGSPLRGWKSKLFQGNPSI